MTQFSSTPNTGSTLQYSNGTNKTSTALSTNIIIAVRVPGSGSPIPIGAVQTLDINEKRQLKMIDEVGTDGHIDSTPVSSTNITGTCNRIRFDGLRIMEAFDRSYLHLASQVYPFDIIITDKQRFDSALWVSTVIKNVWVGGISYSYKQNDWIITDNMTWEAETIFSRVNGGPAAQGGALGLSPYQKGNQNWIEVATDMGSNGRRGSLDAAGLIDLGGSSYGTGIY